jgi:hypothetical protein
MGRAVSVPGAVVDRLSALLQTSTIHNDEQRRLVCDLYQKHWKEICGYIRAHFGAGPPEPEDSVSFTTWCPDASRI